MLKNKKKLMGEFKTFAMRGNVIDLAVGVIIGAAFQKIVSSLVNDLIMPIIGLITGGSNFNEQFLILRLPEGIDKSQVTSLATAATLKVPTFNYGSFITTVLDFLIVALVIFLMVKGINRLNVIKKKEEETPQAPAPTTKRCPYCKSEIAIEATRCPHCTSELDKTE
jgi:large conductance mechanosensitive channel